jgi:outer membrane protein
MQRSTLAAVAALMVLGLPAAQAQTAGTWMVKAGLNRIAPQVTSGNLSAPGLPGTKIDVQEADSLIVTGTYMITSHWSAEFFAGLPYEHDVTGDGAIRGVGRIGTVKQISPTVIAQYRFGEPAARFRPYVGLGLTYAYFYGEEGSGALTALTNPGGRPTQMSVDSAFGLSPQIGASFWLTPKWFLDVSVIKTYLKTTSHLSSGQSIDTKLDPLSVGLSIGYRY